jgi:ribonucleoside-diphosphate reductase beta chain
MLFNEQLSRKPNLYPWAQEYIDKMWQGHWTPNEFDFKSDYGQFKSELTDHEREVVVRTLSAIGQVEIAVKRFWAQLGDNLPHPVMADLGFTMANIEVIHNIAYEKLLEVLQLKNVFEENLKEPVVLGRVNYLRKYLKRTYEDDRRQYIYAIILFTLFVENVSLFSQFYTILWLNRNRNVLKDTAQQIQYTRNEEMLHALAGVKIIQTLRDEYPELFDSVLEERIQEECYEAFIAESAIIDWMIGDYSAPGLNAEILKVYIKNRINDSLGMIGMKRHFELSQHEKLILDETYWMDEETLGNNMSDFFHKRPVDYAKNNKVYVEEDLF